MRLFLRVLAHIGLCALYVYVFYFATPLLGSNWLNWVWTIATGIIILLNFFFINIIYQEMYAKKKYRNNEDTVKQMLVLTIFIEALVTISLTCKIMVYDIGEAGFLFLPVFLCMVFSGINKYFLSYIFMFASILYYVNYVDFSSWHSYTLFICLIITHILIIFSLGNKMGTDNDLLLHRLGFFILLIIIAYMFFFGSMTIHTDNQKYYLLAYILLGVSVSISDNIIVYTISPMIIMTYGIFVMLELHSIYSSILLLLCFAYFICFYISYKSYKSTVKDIVVYLINENYDLKKSYNELVSIINKKGRGRGNSIGGYGNDVAKGFFRAIGRMLAGGLEDIL